MYLVRVKSRRCIVLRPEVGIRGGGRSLYATGA